MSIYIEGRGRSRDRQGNRGSVRGDFMESHLMEGLENLESILQFQRGTGIPLRRTERLELFGKLKESFGTNKNPRKGRAGRQSSGHIILMLRGRKIVSILALMLLS
jgi:hypothetical protein